MSPINVSAGRGSGITGVTVIVVVVVVSRVVIVVSWVAVVVEVLLLGVVDAVCVCVVRVWFGVQRARMEEGMLGGSRGSRLLLPYC